MLAVQYLPAAAIFVARASPSRPAKTLFIGAFSHALAVLDMLCAARILAKASVGMYALLHSWRTHMSTAFATGTIAASLRQPHGDSLLSP